MIKYAGPKPMISQSGIDFDHSKEDKFIYLNIALQLLKAIDHEYYEDKKYIYNINTPHFSEDMLESEIKIYCQNYEVLIDKQNHILEDDFQDELKHVTENKRLDTLEKEVCENNLNMMHDYILQRSINKKVYYCIVGQLAEVVKKDNINYIITPMNPLFVHVLHSIQGALSEQKFPIDTKLDIYEENGEFLTKLSIINR